MIYQVHQQDAELRGEERGEQKEKINNAKGMLHEGLSADLMGQSQILCKVRLGCE